MDSAVHLNSVLELLDGFFTGFQPGLPVKKMCAGTAGLHVTKMCASDKQCIQAVVAELIYFVYRAANTPTRCFGFMFKTQSQNIRHHVTYKATT